MEKTTVYLPSALKARLARSAVASRRSESALIREGIELVTARTADPEPCVPLFSSGRQDLAERVDEYLAEFGER